MTPVDSPVRHPLPDSAETAYMSGIMDWKQYRAILDKLKLTQLAAGELLDIGDRTSRRWALGEARIPTPAAVLLRAVAKGLLTIEDIKKLK